MAVYVRTNARPFPPIATGIALVDGSYNNEAAGGYAVLRDGGGEDRVAALVYMTHLLERRLTEPMPHAAKNIASISPMQAMPSSTSSEHFQAL